MKGFDDELKHFEAYRAAPLPEAEIEAHLVHNGARLWYAVYGKGAAVVLLHGGMGHSGNWGYQAQALVENGYRVIVIDSRGHGRSTRDEQPYSYELMAGDVLAVLDELGIAEAAFVGWSDGACVALVLAAQAPQRAAGVFYFACNMDPSGVNAVVFQQDSAMSRCFGRHTKNYEQLSATPTEFNAFVAAVGEMQRTQPNYTAEDLKKIRVPVTVVQSEHEEFIKPEHAAYLAQTLPNAELVLLKGVSHFAPLQRPEVFNAAMLAFAARVVPAS